MDAAHKLIREHSYGAVTIDAICERAAVKKGSFYYFFDSKSDLAIAAIKAWGLERRALLTEMFKPEIPPVERLRRYLEYLTETQMAAFKETGQFLGCPLFTLGSEICTQDEVIRLLICDFLEGMVRLVETTVAEAQAAGDIEGHDPAAKARIFLAYYEGILTRARIENRPEPVENLAADTLEVIGARPSLVTV